MRQLQKIRQYQRLSQHYGAEPTLTTIAEVAEVALCSERHARTLLRQLAQSGWLLWDAQPGRGHRATLHGKASTSELSAPLMHACLEKGITKVPYSWPMTTRPACITSSRRFSAGNGSSTSRHCVSPGIVRSPRFTRHCSAVAPSNILSVPFTRG